MWVLFALLAGLLFGIRGALYHWTSKLDINRNLLLAGVFSCGFFIYGSLTLFTDQSITVTSLVGIQMGLLSSIANGALTKGFAVGKASLIAILTALPPIVVVIIAYLIWGETLTIVQLIALLALIGGMVIIRYSSDLSLKNLQGVQWGVITLFFFAFNDLTGKWSTIIDAPRYPTLMFMFLTGSIFFFILYFNNRRMSKKEASFTIVSARTELKRYGIGMLVGITNALGMFAILEAFETGNAGLVSALSSIHAIVVLVYTRFIAKEKLNKNEIIGITIILISVVTIQLFKTT